MAIAFPHSLDPNLTNKRFPGNPTQSYRTHQPLKIVGVLQEWERHSPEALKTMLDSLADLKRRGLAIIEE
jgi:rifampin ADP-ribosylating transferase